MNLSFKLICFRNSFFTVGNGKFNYFSQYYADIIEYTLPVKSFRTPQFFQFFIEIQAVQSIKLPFVNSINLSKKK